MVSYESKANVVERGEENLEFVYVVMSGFLSVYSLSEWGEWERIDSLIRGDVFGELYLIYNIPCQVLIQTEERSNLIRIPKKVFEEYIKEDYVENMEAMIEFYSQLFFGK